MIQELAQQSTIQEAVQYLLALVMTYHMVIFALALVTLGLFAIVQVIGSKAGFGEDSFLIKVAVLPFLALHLLAVLIYRIGGFVATVVWRLVTVPITMLRERAAAKRRAEWLQSQAYQRTQEQQRVADIYKITRRYQGTAQQLHKNYVNSLPTKAKE